MRRWQYLSSGIIYGFFVVPMWIYLSLRYRLSPFHMIKANPGFKYGGMEIDSKYHLITPLSNHSSFLNQVFISGKGTVSKKLNESKLLLKKNKISFPFIAKPNKGCVGFGIVKITSWKKLEWLFTNINVDYILQEYCDYPLEFGVYYCKLPWEKEGNIISLTEKKIPFVKGNGKSTVKELVEINPHFKYNKSALLSHAKDISYVPKKGEMYQVIVQGSHTYGSIFIDQKTKITAALTSWSRQVSAMLPGFFIGRYDLKVKSYDHLRKGKGIKIIELNGCMSEPIHIYDDKHTLFFGVKGFFHIYQLVYSIARYNLSHSNKEDNSKVPVIKMIKEFKLFFKNKKSVSRAVG